MAEVHQIGGGIRPLTYCFLHLARTLDTDQADLASFNAGATGKTGVMHQARYYA
jgi:hypothetical protein